MQKSLMQLCLPAVLAICGSLFVSLTPCYRPEVLGVAMPATGTESLISQDDEDEDFEEEEEFRWVWRRREMAEHAEELDAEIEELRADGEFRFARLLDERRKNLRQIIPLIDRVIELEHELDAAYADKEFARIDQLETQLESLIESLERKEYVGELQMNAEELRIARDELAEDGKQDRSQRAAALATGMSRLLERVSKLHEQLDAGNDDEIDELEWQVERLAEPLWLSVDEFYLERELEERREEDEDIAELISELHRVREAIDDFEGDEWPDFLPRDERRLPMSPRTNSPRPTRNIPVVQPILVNQQTLEPYAERDLQQDVAPLLTQYCFDCHSNASSSGELNFESLLAEQPIVKNRRQWINVIEQSKNHVMPPEDATQPTLDERKEIVLSLHNAIYNFDYETVKDPGFESVRRLTHREYSHTVRDLFGADIDVVDRFPDDLTATSGFDNSANSLFIQPLLMERYISIAEHVVTTSLPTPPRSASEKQTYNQVFVSRPSDRVNVKHAAGEVMRKFLFRAFRRPVSEAEIERYSLQIEQIVESGAGFDEAVKATLQTVLISPSFLLLSEQRSPSGNEVYAVNDFDLANRLSYFLWASMPDDQLFQVAEEGNLNDPNILSEQVARMLHDPKSETLGSVFAAQWLGSQHLGKRVRLDPIDNPWCTDSLMQAMRQETSMFFNKLVSDNRPLTELVDADYTFANEELAELYGLRGVRGTEMRRVAVDPSTRGGILGQGSLLAVTSFPGRTSPVVRGKWILDTVLGTPPPPPPPNVSELSEEIESVDRLSFREKLELHREKPNCYACHSQMDPLGFSLENYDWFGRYRSRRGRSTIDATGQLPNGSQFEGLSGLKQVIVEQREADLVRQLTQKLLAYSLGRQLEYFDEPAIREIVAEVGRDQNRMQTLIQEIVLSYPFRYKRLPE